MSWWSKREQLKVRVPRRFRCKVEAIIGTTSGTQGGTGKSAGTGGGGSSQGSGSGASGAERQRRIGWKRPGRSDHNQEQLEIIGQEESRIVVFEHREIGKLIERQYLVIVNVLIVRFQRDVEFGFVDGWHEWHIVRVFVGIVSIVGRRRDID